MITPFDIILFILACTVVTLLCCGAMTMLILGALDDVKKLLKKEKEKEDAQP